MSGIGSRGYRVRDWIVDQIAQGRLRPGDRLPTERELAALLDISALTVHRALRYLAREGLVQRRRRRGTVLVQLPSELRSAANTPQMLLLTSKSMGDIEGDFYLGSLYQGIQQAQQENPLLLRWTAYETYHLQPESAGRDIQGVLAIAPPLHYLGLLKELQHRVPVVVLGADASAWGIPSVDSDNQQGMREMVHLLLKMGHRRFIGLFADQIALNTLDRQRTFLSTLVQHGIPESDIWLFLSQDTFHLEPAVQDALRTLLTLPTSKRPTAIVGGGFYLAMVALQIASETNLSVPQTLSITGFDDPPAAALTVPPLTTVRQPLKQMGALALTILADLVQGRSLAATCIKLPVELILRQTTAHCPIGG